jgi:hypothetical protein
MCADIDNCPTISNALQEDSYPPQGNGIGNACECEGNFDCDSDIDGTDAATFKGDVGRHLMTDPCTDLNPCNGDFSCDGDVDGSDAALFKQDFGRGYLLQCPRCVKGSVWCNY